MSDFVRKPLLARLNRRNILTRVENIERITGARPSARTGNLAAIAPQIFGTSGMIDPNGVTLVALAFPSESYVQWRADVDGGQVAKLLGWYVNGTASGSYLIGRGKDSSHKGTVGIAAMPYSDTDYTTGVIFDIDMGGEAVLDLRNGTNNASGQQALVIQTKVSASSTDNDRMNDALYLDTHTLGTPAVGFGSSLTFRAVDSTGEVESLGFIGARYTDVTSGSEDTQIVLGWRTAGANNSGVLFFDGTFTPAIAGTATAGAGTYSVQLGRYSQVGNVVFFKIALVWSAHTGTGNMIVTGLPLTSAATFSTPVTVYFSNVTLPAVGDKVQAFIPASSTQVTLESVASGASAALALDTAATLILAGWYMV